MSMGMNAYKPKKKDYLDPTQFDTRGPVTQASTQAFSDAQTMPRTPLAAAQNPSPAQSEIASMNKLGASFRAGADRMRRGQFTEAERTPDPQVVQAARERSAMAQAGGSPLSQINAGLEGRAAGMQIANSATARATPESRSAIAGMSPLAGSAAAMTIGAERERAAREREDAEYKAGIQKFSGKVMDGYKDSDGNGIDDRDEPVAEKYGKLGINTLNQLDSMNAKYRIYKGAYLKDPNAQKQSRPMTFDEFAQNEQENFKKRPLYGVPGSGEEGSNNAYEQAASAIRGNRQQQQLEDAERRAPRVEQARQQGLVSSTVAEALRRGANPAQANQMGLAMLQRDLALRESQKIRDDQTNVLTMQDAGQTTRTGILGEAQKYGADQQLAAAEDTNRTSVSTNKTTNESNIRQAEINAEAQANRDQERNTADMERLKMQLNDPAKRIETVGQIMSMHPDRAAQAARAQAEAQFVQAYPNAPINQVQAAGDRAAQSALAAAVPMWNAMVSDPQIQSVIPGSSATSVPVPNLSPLGNFMPQQTVTIPGQSPLQAYTPPAPGSASAQSPSAGAIPGSGWTAPKQADETSVLSAIKKVEQFNGGRRATREQIAEQLLSEGYAVDPTSPTYRFIEGQIEEYLQSGDKRFTTPNPSPPSFDTSSSIS